MSVAKAKNRLWVTLLIAISIAVFFWFDLQQFLSLTALKQQQLALNSMVSANPLIAATIFLAVYILATALSVPGAAILTLAGGALFGFLYGTILVSVASTIGATLAFLASRYLFRDAVHSRFGKRLKLFDDGFRKDGAFYLLSLRLLPIFPFFLINLLMGLTSISTLTYALVSQIGMLPATLAFVFAGTQLATVASTQDILSPRLLSAFAVLGVMPLILRYALNWFAARRVYRKYKKPKKFDYNLIVIGAGSAGLVSSYIAATIKAKVLLIERHKMGGDCLNTGCVPSKALLRTAKLLFEAQNSRCYGISKLEIEFDFAEAMERVQHVIAKIEPHDSVERYTDLGVQVMHGHAKLVSPWEVEVNKKKLSARSIILATGAQPLTPNIPGLDQVEALTSDTIWNLRELPKRLVVLGGGPIGCELAQAFARFGSAVTQIEMAPRLLPREDSDAAHEITEQFRAEGIDVRVGHKALRISKTESGAVLTCEFNGGEVSIVFDRILLALGRRANVEGFGLQELGVALQQRGTIEADALMRTNFPNIYVCGDVTGPYQFTHVAAHQAWYASVNALLSPFWSFQVDYRVIPWATFTEPEVARVGLSEDEAAEQNIAVEVTRYGIDDLDRAIADGVDRGFVKVLTAPGTDRILGVSIVGSHAGDLLAEFVLAMKHGIGLNKILGTIHIYPTMAEANKYVAGNWKRAHAPQMALRWAQRFFRWQRS